MNSKTEKKQKKLQKDEKEFKIALIIVCAIILIFVAIFFSVKYLPSLIEEWKFKSSLVDFTATESYIEDEKGNKFYPTNRSVEAINTDKAYGFLDGVQYSLISFMNEDGKTPEYIVESKNGSKGVVLRHETAKEITLSTFEPISADLCPSTSNYPDDYFVAPDEYLNNGGSSRNDEKYIKMIYDALTSGKEVPTPKTQKSSVWIKLKSQKFPGLYYSVVFMIDENEIAYLYEIGTGKYTLAPDLLTVRLS